VRISVLYIVKIIFSVFVKTKEAWEVFKNNKLGFLSKMKNENVKTTE
jgi:hypothetical protein